MKMDRREVSGRAIRGDVRPFPPVHGPYIQMDDLSKGSLNDAG